MCFKFLILII